MQQSRYQTLQAETPAQMDMALALRSVCFRAGRGNDGDVFDAASIHTLIVDAHSGEAVAGVRSVVHATAQAAATGYTGQRYDLGPWLTQAKLPVVEVGRVCVHPQRQDPDVLRLLWGALARITLDHSAMALFGCVSFPVADADRHADVLSALGAGPVFPPAYGPRPLAAQIIRLADVSGDPSRGQRGLPPLLRTYLLMGGHVGDHAVVDADLDTLHIFAGLDVSAIPTARVRSLMAAAP